MQGEKISMVDLHTQYLRLKSEIDEAMQGVIASGSFINGPQVGQFARHLADYLQAPHVIPCANGTDALQIALMRLNLQRGDEVIMPAFTYAAAAEAAILLGLTPVLVDVDSRTFNLSPPLVGQAISERSSAILVVHLFGQCCDMQPILEIAGRHKLPLIEDNAQSLGAEYTFPDGKRLQAGTMGELGALSFFPTKILGAYGDGGALIVRDRELAESVRMTTLHGQSQKYHHQMIGCNSRLDTLQAALLDVKLRYIDSFIASRRRAAAFYEEALKEVEEIVLPYRQPSSTHVYHQYSLQVKGGKRDALQAWLKRKGIPTSVYYPLPIDEQPAFRPYLRTSGELTVARQLCRSVLSLPIHTEMTEAQLSHITQGIRSFFSAQ
ncbi:MAG: DegT/DnrJ/EryC1/StrS family aminotransferase [Tannerellaceae bacterium]|jgi:dTDP-4-amino-4,6-dideoxygalactose transaminase|nr:DegT/DnrJ/EryC1/StrS family aminotransferase [Tannerellaceae bacterium]